MSIMCMHGKDGKHVVCASDASPVLKKVGERLFDFKWGLDYSHGKFMWGVWWKNRLKFGRTY